MRYTNLHYYYYMNCSEVKNQIQKAIAAEFGIPVDRLYLTKPTFFSRMDTTPPHTIHDEYWHTHVDKVCYKCNSHWLS